MIVLTGGSGYVGSEFVRQLNFRRLPFRTLSRRHGDFEDLSLLTKRLEQLGASKVIHCAGYTGKPNVDACEGDKARCLFGNTVLPAVMAESCAALGIPWGHVSSGCIYTGRLGNGKGFTEQDPPNFTFRNNNCSFYSGTKALGEELLADAPRCYIWRLRIPFSNVDGPRNYLSKLMRYPRLLEAENSLSSLPDFVAAALDCFEKNVPYGIYNLTNPGSSTTTSVVRMIQKSRVCEREFHFFKSDAEFMRVAATTPRSNCVLDSSKAVQAGLHLPPVEQAVEDALQTWSAEKNSRTTGKRELSSSAESE